MSETANLPSLLKTAEEINSSEITPETIDKIALYAEDFDRWYTAYENSVKAGAPINSKEELQALLEVHEKVVELSEKLKDTLPAELSKLRTKGKGIMAYTDTLPKKISVTKPRKG